MKDQQMNNIGTQEEVNNATPWQENAQQDGNNVPSPGKNESVGTNDKPLTTDGFHTLLAANTFKLSKLRAAYATEIADLQKEYDDTLDGILDREHLANFELREVRDEYEKAKEEYEQTLRELKRQCNEAGQAYNKGKAEAKNRWSVDNETIQSERHNLFERFRKSGGVLPQGTEGLLHPSWAREKKGGMSDE